MKIAIIGSGISGLACAYFLSRKYEVTLFEEADYLGGHTHTVEVHDTCGSHNIDTGFIVCNKRTYPNFIRLLTELDVNLQPSSMGFSVKDVASNLEYSGHNLNTVFAQRKNLLNVKFIKMLADISRFNKHAKQFLQHPSDLTLEQFIATHSIGTYATQYYILPLISAIWSTSTAEAAKFPVDFLFRFLNNHGLLSLNEAPQWYTVENGSSSYVQKLRAKMSAIVAINSKVLEVVRLENGVRVKTACMQEDFDKVVFATHADQALQALANPRLEEVEILGKIKFQDNNVTLHVDTSVLPKAKRAWSSWNYLLNNNKLPNLTYNMNILQNINSQTTYCVSLNLDEYINKDLIIAKYIYAHPIYNADSLQATMQWGEINQHDIYYAGAYWGYGFHEDGLNSAIRVVNAIDKEILCKTPYIQVF